MTTIQQHLRKHRNIFSPDLIDVRSSVICPEYYVELTYGKFMGEEMWGVTLWRETNTNDKTRMPYTNHCPGIIDDEPFPGKCFRTRDEAEGYARFLHGRVALRGTRLRK